MINAMTTEMRNTGIDVVGNMSWARTFVSFTIRRRICSKLWSPIVRLDWKARELCLWVAAPPFTVEDARQALGERILDFDQYAADSSIEIVSARDWYLHTDGSFDLKRVIAGWNQKIMPRIGQSLHRREGDRRYGLA